MKTLKTVWKVLKITAKVASFLMNEKSWKDLLSEIKGTWRS